MAVYKFPDSPPTSDEPTGTCNACGYRREETKHQKIFGQWVCDLALLDNGHWIHSNRIYEQELLGRKVVLKLIPDV